MCRRVSVSNAEVELGVIRINDMSDVRLLDAMD